ncbi:uncharacterized protein METZ01_LOCUS166535 [marine metagenome]|uniref:UPF0033 domain-containing protein n=1 Tax=marine metagenome TaxID=408172 RepID=A0A382BJG6_9ZZZZ
MVDGGIVSLDLLGFLCPVPVHETRRAVEKAAQGTLFEVLCDDPETLHDIPALCDRMGLVLLGVNEDAGEYAFRIEKR